MRVFIISSLIEASGNWVTTKRFEHSLASIGCTVRLFDHQKLTPEKLEEESANVDLIIGIHSFKSGRLCLNLKRVPFIIVLSGTDINEDLSSVLDKFDPRTSGINWLTTKKSETIVAACYHASSVISLSNSMATRFENACSKLPLDIQSEIFSKLHVIPQGIEDSILSIGRIRLSSLNDQESNDFNVGTLNDSYFHSLLNIPLANPIFLLVCSVRAVKAPMYLVDSFRLWHKRDSRINLVIVGPLLEQQSTDQLFAHFRKSSPDIRRDFVISPLSNAATGVHYVPPVSRKTLLNALRGVTAVLNSSVSEGQSSALLEAMAAAVPIVARDNEGNRELLSRLPSSLTHPKDVPSLECNQVDLQEGNRGFLFQSPEDCIHACQRIVYGASAPISRTSVISDSTVSVDSLDCVFDDNPEPLLHPGKSSLAHLPIPNVSKGQCTTVFKELATRSFDYVCSFHSEAKEKEKWKELIIALKK